MPESGPDAEEIFRQALYLPGADRASFLDRTCARHLEVRARVDLLLAAAASTSAVPGPDGTTPPPDRRRVTAATEKPGDTIDRYRLLRRIGEGGFGAVWLAEQAAPVRRRVALKLVKLGMDTREFLARFDQERQALALMDHPNIAKVFDAGSTPTGRPYFVMELVDGAPITQFCDHPALSIDTRIDLFTKVCAAVQHAHQKGIIHRDIKPSNILVASSDEGPLPKVIDFGIAKVMQGTPGDHTTLTRFEQTIGTPLYMSPEQAAGGLDIDTRSDVYSLGVLLYELLTGCTPFDASLVNRGLDEMRRIIRDTEPRRPSVAVAAMAEDKKARVAERRQVEPTQLGRRLAGDLDWIVMKAIDKDRARRYETPTALAEDLRRHLHSEPVTACPLSRAYRLGRLVRRNKLAFGAGAAVLLALVVGFTVSTVMFFRENTARRRAMAAEQEQSLMRQQADLARATESKLRKQAVAAEQEQSRLRANEEKLRQVAESEERKAKVEAEKSKQVARCLKEMLESVGPSVALGRDTTMLREILEKTTPRLGESLKEQPEVDAELRETIAIVYRDLGEYDKAGGLLNQVLGIRRATLPDGHPDVLQSMSNCGEALHSLGKLDEAEKMFREAITAWRRTPDGAQSEDVAKSLSGLGWVLQDLGRLTESEATLREALQMKRKLLGPDDISVAMSLNNLASVLADENKLAEAESMHRDALAIRSKRLGAEHPDVAQSLNNLAAVLAAEGKLAEAEAGYREALAMAKKLLPAGHQHIVAAINNLAGTLMREENLDEAQALYREVLAITVKTEPGGWRENAQRCALGLCLKTAHKFEEAEEMLRAGCQGLKNSLDKIPSQYSRLLVDNLAQLVDLDQATGNDEKIADDRRELEIQEAAAKKLEAR